MYPYTWFQSAFGGLPNKGIIRGKSPNMVKKNCQFLAVFWKKMKDFEKNRQNRQNIFFISEFGDEKSLRIFFRGKMK